MSSSDHTFRRILAFLLLVIAVLVGVVAVTLHNLGRSVASSEWVNHTHATRTEAAEILSSSHAAEARSCALSHHGRPA